MINILNRAILMSTPLLIGAVAEVYAERTGMMIIAIEGIFLLGAWGGFLGVYLTQSYLLGILFAAFLGLVAAALYGFITIYLKQHQIVTGTALNILIAGLVAFFHRVIFGIPLLPLTIEPLHTAPIPLLHKIPLLGQILFNQNILTYCAYILAPVAFFILFRTSLGLIIRSTGENPEAVDVAGLKVESIRFRVTLFAGFLGAIAGSFYSVVYLGMFTNTIIGGRGWIAFAICFLGNWNPLGAMLGAIIFGIAESVAIYMQSSGQMTIPNELFIALPYILTIVLTLARRKFNVPSKLGIPYLKGN